MAEEEKDPMVAMEERLAKLEELVEDIVEDKLKDMQEPEEEVEASEDEEEVVDNSEENLDILEELKQENEELRASLAQYEREAVKTELSETIPSLDDDLFDHLMSLKEVDPTLYEKTVVTLSEGPKVVSKPSGPKGRSGEPASPEKPVTLAEAKKEADAKGLKGALKVDYLQERGFLK